MTHKARVLKRLNQLTIPEVASESQCIPANKVLLKKKKVFAFSAGENSTPFSTDSFKITCEDEPPLPYLLAINNFYSVNCVLRPLSIRVLAYA